MSQIMDLDPSSVVVGARMRQEFDEAALSELAENILAHGQLQPIGVTRTEDGKWELVYGHRRLLACQQAGIPVKAIEVPQHDALERALREFSENAARRDFTPLEKAESARRLHTLLKQRHGENWTVRQSAKALGVSHSYLASLLRVYEGVFEQGKVPFEEARNCSLRKLVNLCRAASAVQERSETSVTVLQGDFRDWRALGVPQKHFHLMFTRIKGGHREDAEALWAFANEVLLENMGGAVVFVPWHLWPIHRAVAETSGFQAVYPRPFIWIKGAGGTSLYAPALPTPCYEVAVIAKRQKFPMRLTNHADWVSLKDRNNVVELGKRILEIFCEPHWSMIDPCAGKGDFVQAAVAYGLPEVYAIELDAYKCKEIRELSK